MTDEARRGDRWTTRGLLVVIGACAGGGLIGSIYLLSMLTTQPLPATNGLTGEPLARWQADPRFFVRDGHTWVTNHPFLAPQRFSVPKPANEWRVFVFGGSQAQGSPYVHGNVYWLREHGRAQRLVNEGGISTWLQRYLQSLKPQSDVVVINAAIGAQDITTAAAVFAEVARIGEPDLTILLSGNNESYGLDLETADDIEEAMATIVPRFKAALERIVDLSTERKIPTYVLTVPSNLSGWAPVSLEGTDLRASVPSEGALGCREEGLPAEGCDWLQARARLAAGDIDDAYRLFVSAKDRDAALVRTPTELNEILRRQSGPFVDTFDLEKQIRTVAKNSIPGFDLFHDFCHLTIQANVLVAREIARFHAALQGLPPRPLPVIDPKPLMREALSQLYSIKEAKWRRLRDDPAYELYGRTNMEKVRLHYERSGEFIDIVEDDYHSLMDLYRIDKERESAASLVEKYENLAETGGRPPGE